VVVWGLGGVVEGKVESNQPPSGGCRVVADHVHLFAVTEHSIDPGSPYAR
jgi:hypothetical protein